MHPGVWFGHKGSKPAGINDFRTAWSVEDASDDTFVCVEAADNSEYKTTPGFEVARLGKVPANLTDATMLPVTWYQFDP